MERRTALCGTGLVLGTSLAGCLKSIGDETDPPTAEPTPVTACETGRAVLEAIGNEEYETAAGYFPTALKERKHGPSSADQYRQLETPDEISDIECGDATPEADLAARFSELLDGDVAAARTIEYAATIELGSETIVTTPLVVAVKIDGDWYAWLDSELVPRPNAEVSVDEDGLEMTTVTYTSGAASVSVYVTGEGIDDPTAHRLDTPGDVTTIETPDVPPGQYDVVAAYGPYEEGGHDTVIAEFELVDREAWRGVDEIVFSAETVAWVGRAPGHVEDVENPTLVLEEGRTYRIGWDRGNGMAHNIEMRDATGHVVDDYETEITVDPDDGQFLTVTTTEDLSTYRCAPHPAMEGTVEVVDQL